MHFGNEPSCSPRTTSQQRNCTAQSNLKRPTPDVALARQENASKASADAWQWTRHHATRRVDRQQAACGHAHAHADGSIVFIAHTSAGLQDPDAAGCQRTGPPPLCRYISQEFSACFSACRPIPLFLLPWNVEQSEDTHLTITSIGSSLDSLYQVFRSQKHVVHLRCNKPDTCNRFLQIQYSRPYSLTSVFKWFNWVPGSSSYNGQIVSEETTTVTVLLDTRNQEQSNKDDSKAMFKIVGYSGFVELLCPLQ